MILEQIDSSISKQFTLNQIDKMHKRFPILKTLGWGFCGMASMYLLRILLKHNINAVMLQGEINNPVIYNNFINLLSNYSGDSITFKELIQYIDITKPLDKQKRLGHVVIQINNDIFDITGVQFGLPVLYSLDEFKQNFKNIKPFIDDGYPTKKLVEEFDNKYSVTRK